MSRRTYRFPPCPAWDVEGTESWLEDMAAGGLFLGEDGFFFAGFAAFERGEARHVRYRLDAAPKNISALADTDKPPEDAAELAEACGWTFVASRGQFFIYRADSADAPELNTDPRVQAIALSDVRRRVRTNVMTAAAMAVVYPLLLLRGRVLLFALGLGTPFALFLLALLLLSAVSSICSAVHLSRLGKKLRAGEGLEHKKNWRRRAGLYRFGRALTAGLWALALVLLLNKWGAAVMDEGQIPLAQNTADMPFATMADLAAGDYTLSSFDFSNTVELRGDVLAPVIIDWRETASVALPDGRVLDGGYYADYMQAASPCIAREAAREYLREGRSSKHYEPLALPELGADYAAAYLDGSHFPNLIVQKGSRVIHVLFYQTSESYEMPLEQWAKIVAGSLG